MKKINKKRKILKTHDDNEKKIKIWFYLLIFQDDLPRFYFFRFYFKGSELQKSEAMLGDLGSNEVFTP